MNSEMLGYYLQHIDMGIEAADAMRMAEEEEHMRASLRASGGGLSVDRMSRSSAGGRWSALRGTLRASSMLLHILPEGRYSSCTNMHSNYCVYY